MGLRAFARRLTGLTGLTPVPRPLPALRDSYPVVAWNESHDELYLNEEDLMSDQYGGARSGRMTSRAANYEEIPRNGANRDHLSNAEAVYLQGVNALRAELGSAKDELAIVKAENAALSARVDVLTEMLNQKTADANRWQVLSTEIVCALTTSSGIINEVLNKAHMEAKNIMPSRQATVEAIDKEVQRRQDNPQGASPEQLEEIMRSQGQPPDDGAPPPRFLVEKGPAHPVEAGRTDRT